MNKENKLLKISPKSLDRLSKSLMNYEAGIRGMLLNLTKYVYYYNIKPEFDCGADKLQLVTIDKKALEIELKVTEDSMILIDDLLKGLRIFEKNYLLMLRSYEYLSRNGSLKERYLEAFSIINKEVALDLMVVNEIIHETMLINKCADGEI